MANQAKHALLFGATGLVGSHLLRQLLASPSFTKVTAVTRRPLPVTHAKLENVVCDFSGAALPSLPAGIDVAFCCLGTTLKQAGSKAGFYAVDHDLVLRCADWSRQANVAHFVAVSAMGASAASPVYYNQVKAAAEAGLVAAGFARLSLIQPSLLLGEREGPFRAGEALGIKLAPLFGPLMAGPLAAYRPILASDVAAGMLACALHASSESVERLRWRDIMALLGKH